MSLMNLKKTLFFQKNIDYVYEGSELFTATLVSLCALSSCMSSQHTLNFKVQIYRLSSEDFVDPFLLGHLS